MKGESSTVVTWGFTGRGDRMTGGSSRNTVVLEKLSGLGEVGCEGLGVEFDVNKSVKSVRHH